MSQSPQTGQFNSYANPIFSLSKTMKMSQSPQTGQFNSYKEVKMKEAWIEKVSIPSNGSIQFLRSDSVAVAVGYAKSQSPQTGQFNSYKELERFITFSDLNVSIPSNGSIQFLHAELELILKKYS